MIANYDMLLNLLRDMLLMNDIELFSSDNCYFGM